MKPNYNNVTEPDCDLCKKETKQLWVRKINGKLVQLCKECHLEWDKK